MKAEGMFIDKQQIMVGQGTFSNMSDTELQSELQRQESIANTINVTAEICTQAEDKDSKDR